MLKRKSFLRRTPLKRSTKPLKRKTFLRAVGKTSYRRRARDTDFMSFVLWQPCALEGVHGAGPCDGRVQADHAGWRAKGIKAPDNTCIALCMGHHSQRTDYRGFFKNWNGHEMRSWCDQRIHFTQTLYKHLVALHQTPWRRRGEMRA